VIAQTAPQAAYSPPSVVGATNGSNGQPGGDAGREQPGRGFRFWACARGAEGRSRTTAVWGLWLDRALVFTSDTESVAVGDPTAFPASIVQLDDDGAVKLVDGTVERVDDPTTLSRFVSECEAKYGFEPDPADPDTPVFVVRSSPTG
jgi:hypothetical protein